MLSMIERGTRNIIIPAWHKTDTQLISALHKNRYEPLFEQTAMVLRLCEKIEYAPNSLELKEVTTDEYAVIWTEISSQAFGYNIHAPVIKKVMRTPKIKLILAFLNNVPVGTGLLLENSGVTGIHMVGVVPVYRRQGIARKIMQNLIGICHESDSTHATLQASVMAESLYEQLGFEKQFTIMNFGNPRFND